MRRSPAELLDLAVGGAEPGISNQCMHVARRELPAEPGETEQEVAALFATPGAHQMVGEPVEEKAVLSDFHPGCAFSGR